MRSHQRLGRSSFAELLLDEVARTLPEEDADALEQEVIDLGFHAYCADALQRRKGVSGGA